MAYQDWWFALVASDAVAFDPVAHKRRDLPVIGVKSNETEQKGQATLTLTMGTQVTGLGGAGKAWGWLSRELANGTIHPMRLGFVTTVPTRGSGGEDSIEVEFQCSPVDWDSNEAVAIQPYNVPPYADPALIPEAQRTSAREVLDGSYRTVHCHPATHAFTCPDKLGIGLPTFNFPRPWGPPSDGPPSTRIISKIVAAVVITLTCEYTQAYDGILDLTNNLLTSTAYGLIDTLTPDQLERSWPKAGAKFQGDSGYTFYSASLTRQTPAQVADSDLANPPPPQAGPFTAAPEKNKNQYYKNAISSRNYTSPYQATNEAGQQVTRYNYKQAQTGDPSDLYACPVSFDRAYYDAKLSLWYSVRQKRSETITFVVRNGAVGTTPGEVRYLNLKCQNVLDNSSIQPWLPGVNYTAGQTRRVGSAEVICIQPHISAGTWAADQTVRLQNGQTVPCWALQSGITAPLADPTANSYFKTARGEVTFQAAVLKGRRIIADSVRNVEVKVRHQLTDDLLDCVTAANAVITCPPDLLDGGTVTGKVTEVEIVSDEDDEYIDVTVTAATGTGNGFVASPTDVNGNPVTGNVGSVGQVNCTGQAWDVIQYQGFQYYAPVILPGINGLAKLVNASDDQAAYVAANDFLLGDAVRGLDQSADPGNLLKQVPTGLYIGLTKISGYGTLTSAFAPVTMGVWQGPKQYAIPAS